MIRDKRTMYDMLARGELGNTLPQYFTLQEWANHAHEFPTWGIRVTTGRGGPDARSRLNVCTANVAPYVLKNFAEGEYNISGMVDPFVTFRAEVVELDNGLSVSYVVGYPETLAIPGGAHPWRYAFACLARRAYGIRALEILRHFVPENDLNDIRALIDAYPRHVVEFSVADRCVGKIPHRQAVIWEVRNY